jgi:uncharacterized protein (TIGR02594 family)
MPTLLEVWESRLGIAEVAGPQSNPVILEWCKAVGWESIKDDETAWCATSMNAACIEAGLPMTPHPNRPAARSFLMWGKEVAPVEVAPGDVVVWPRGNSAWQGHVNCVKEVRRKGNKTEVRCIGGNQSHPSGGAVTLTGWQDIKGALPNGVRRAVPATVPDLRKAGSTEIKKADRVQNAGSLLTFLAAIVAAVKELFGPVDVPKFADMKEGLDWWQMILGGANAVGKLLLDNPWLGGTLLVGGVLVLVGRQIKAARVAKHEAGVPLSVEVAKLEAA